MDPQKVTQNADVTITVLKKNTDICLEYHCTKSVRIWSFSGPYFAVFALNTLNSPSPYSVRMRENTDQKKSEYGHFSRSVYVYLFVNLQKSSSFNQYEVIHIHIYK